MKQHTRDELRQLIPFFVAGTLDDEERRAVEQAVTEEPSFKEDLSFWQSAATAVRGQATYAAAGHPSSELLVCHAEGREIADEGTARALEEHITTCTRCRKELAMIQASLDVRAQHRDRIPARVRLWPRLAAAAVVLLVGALVLTRWLDRETRPTYTLAPLESTRSLDPAALPVVVIPATMDSVEFRLSIPAVDVAELTYRVRLASPLTYDIWSIADFVLLEYDDQTDQILVVLDIATAFPLDADYQFEVEEIVPAGAGLLPETYFYVFRVEREG